MTETKKVIFKISRFNPEFDEKPHFQEFEVEIPKGMTVLEALYFIKESIDPTLTFRGFCRSGICGSCSVKVNGHPKLACKTQIWQETERFGTNILKIEPLGNMKVIRDLVVDFSEAEEKLKKVKPYLIPDPEVVPDTNDEESIIYPEEMEKFDKFTDCILCGTCYSMCPAVMLVEDYAGPFQFGKTFRFAEDPRDGLKKERSKLAYAFELWKCIRCERCADICPKHIHPVEAITNLRAMSIEKGLTSNPGARHAIAFYKSVTSTGILNEALIPVMSKGIKGIIENIPVALSFLLKGKMPPPILKPIEDIEGFKKVVSLSAEVE
ncbi:succinate dehydrogenase/fumarate reductase iron-sulfur subunit [Desulfurobacterium sp.]